MPVRSELRGAVLMLIGVAFLSANDALSKYLAEQYPLGEVIFLRQLASFVFILPYALMTTGRASFRVVNVPGQILRAIAFVCTATFMVAGLAYLPLAIATAIAFSSPLWVAALAGPVLGESVSIRRWTAILAGFAGVILIIRPGGASFTWALMWPLAAALANAVRDMTTRSLSRTDSAMSILLWSGFASLVVSAAMLPFGWQSVTTVDALWLLLAGLLNAIAHFSMISALRFADASALSPFRYSSLIWAVAFGWLIWGHLPDAWSTLGTVIIVIAAISAVEHRAARPATAQV